MVMGDYRHDVFLGIPFEKEGTSDPSRKYDFFDSIAEEIASLGKTVFMPHRVVEDDWSAPRVNREVMGSLENSDLALMYLGIESTAVGMMIARAAMKELPAFYFFEHGKVIDHSRSMADAVWGNGWPDEITYRTETEAVQKIKSAVSEFYDNR